MTTSTRPACQDLDGDLWFPTSYDTPAGRAQTSDAIRICQQCPVRLQCLEDAMEAEGGKKLDGRYGIRGGYTPADRFNGRRAATRAHTRRQRTRAAA